MIEFIADGAFKLGEQVMQLELKADELHSAWRLLAGGTLNQDARQALIRLADAADRLNVAGSQLGLASAEMRRWKQGL
jgi:hypothetical protein